MKEPRISLNQEWIDGACRTNLLQAGLNFEYLEGLHIELKIEKPFSYVTITVNILGDQREFTFHVHEDTTIGSLCFTLDMELENIKNWLNLETWERELKD